MKKLLSLVICLTAALSANAHYEMNITSVTGAPFCKGESFTLTFGIHFAFDSSNVFTVQMSDKNGSFANPTAVGTATGTGPATINCVIPSNMPAGTGYLFRVVSTSPAETGDPTTTSYRVVNNPSSTITPSGTDTICFGTSLTMNASTGNNLSYQWYKGSNVIAGAITSQYATSMPGSYRVRVTNWAGCSKMSAYKKVIRVQCNRIADDQHHIAAWPVPFTSQFFISLEDIQSTEADISVYDQQGRMVYNAASLITGDNSVLELQTSDWPAGIYILKVQTDDFIETTRLVKAD